MLSIALYARKSVERENSISCETQLEYCRAMIKPDEKNEETLTFVDNGFSGGNINREGFLNMMTKIEQGMIRKVIVYRLDRISRSLSDFINILNKFKQYGVEFVSTQEAFDTSSPYGELIVKILAVFAEFERQSIISRITQAYEHRSEMGFYMGGRKPYGYELEAAVINNIKTKKLKAVPDEAEQIKYMFNTYSEEGMTLGKLLDLLVKKRINPTSGGAWTTAKLSAILRNPIYVCADYRMYEYFQNKTASIVSPPDAFDGIHGIQLYGKTKQKKVTDNLSGVKVVVMAHEGIIDSETWIKCQQKLLRNKQIGNSVSNKTSWLGGKLVCRQCGRTMTTIKGKLGNGETRRYFVCTGKTHHRTCKGANCTVYAESLEKMVYKEIQKKLGILQEIKLAKKAINPQVNELRNRLKNIELAGEQIADAIINQSAAVELIEILSRKAEKLSFEKTVILQALQDAENKSDEIIPPVTITERWQKATFEDKRNVCGIIIQKIVIDERGDVEIVWNI